MCMRSGFWVVLAALAMGFPAQGSAQSTLEYATLISETSAAAAGAAGHKKNQSQNDTQTNDSDQGPIGSGLSSLYGQAGDAMSQKSGGFLGQLGQPAGAATAPAETPSPSPAPQANAPAAQEAPGPKSVSVLLRNGLTITGALVERNADYIKVDSAGVVVTYFTD